MKAAALLAFLCLACGSVPPVYVPPAEGSVRPGVNQRFLDPAIDLERYIELFEGESREIAENHRKIVTALQLEADTDFADIGAGTGLFVPEVRRWISEGTIFAVDISPGFVEHLEARRAEEGWSNVEVVLCQENTVALAKASIDVAFVCDTYHHFEYPQSTLGSLHHALRAGGTLFVVDFERIPGESREWVLNHVRAGKEVFIQEIEAAGFRFEAELDLPELRENYVLRFRRL